MSRITTHVLDTTRGRPAADVSVALERKRDDGWDSIGRGRTDTDGRLRTLVAEGAPLAGGTYRLVFETDGYFTSAGQPTFYPRVIVEFVVDPAEPHYHVPVLLGPFGYTTYRGS